MVRREKPWRGHLPATKAALLKVMLAANSAAPIPQPGRVLFTAAEFWAAARHRTLIELLREDPIGTLTAAEEAFIAIGLITVSSIVRRACAALSHGKREVALQRVSGRIEDDFAAIEDPVDEKLATYAQENV